MATPQLDPQFPCVLAGAIAWLMAPMLAHVLTKSFLFL